MGNIGKRIGMLEARRPATTIAWHRIIQQPGQTLDAALEAYGRDRIGDADRLIVRRIIDGQLAAGGILQ